MTEATAVKADTDRYPYVLIPEGELFPSEYNARNTHTDGDVDKMAANIKVRGIINAPVVSQTKDGWEIIAGLLRVLGGRKAGLTAIICRNASGASAAEKLELSVSENDVRRDMTDLQRYKAFDKLFRAGRSIEQIAARFDMPELEVRKHLAIGGLPKPIIAMAEKGKLDDGSLKLLTRASRDQLDRFSKLKKPPRYAHDVRHWLGGKKGGNQQIPVEHAIFKRELYKGEIVQDLFKSNWSDDTGEYFVDATQFWQLQNAAINARVARYEKQGWPVKKLTGYFNKWDYQSAAKDKGGQVFYIVHDTGEVEFYRGWKRPTGRPASGLSKPAGDKPAEKPELSQSFQHYLKEIRHAAVQDALIDNPEAAVAVNIACMLTNANNWRIDNPDHLREQKVRGEKQRKSLNDNPHRKDVVEAYVAMLEELGGKTGHGGRLVDALVQYGLEDLIYFLSVATAYRLGSGYDNKLNSAAAAALELDQVEEFTADDVFWAGIQSKPTLLAILKELGQKPDDKATLAQLRTAAKKAAPADWRPRWLQFPGSYYGKASGLFLLGRK